MKPSTLRTLQALRNLWREQNFKFTPEQELQYQMMTLVRKDQIKAWVAEGLVA